MIDVLSHRKIYEINKYQIKKNKKVQLRAYSKAVCEKQFSTTLTEKDYWADNSYYSGSEDTIYGQ